MEEKLRRFERRLERERRARKHAEALIEEKSRQLYEANKKLGEFNVVLESRVEEAIAEIREQNTQLERRMTALGAVNSVATALCSLSEVDVLLDRVMREAKQVMHAQASSLLLLDSDRERLHFHITTGEGSAALENFTMKVGQGIAGHVAGTGESVVVADVYEDSRFDRSFDEESGIRTRSLLAVPIKAKDDIVGVAEVINKVDGGCFDEHDLSLFESLVSAIGVALENARLFEQTQHMAEELRTALEKERWLSIQKEKMETYVSQHVVDEISRNREQKLALGGRNVTASIMFSDIKGFTRLSEEMEPQKLVAFLNTYMSAMTHEIQEHGGHVDKFLGDGIMAVFTEASHALQAVRAGLAMHERLKALRSEWEVSRPELHDIDMRVGINTGEVVVGNIGSETRMDYTLIGDNVNVAARIEAACTPGRLFVSESCYEQVKDQVLAKKMEPIKVRNREKSVQTYDLQSLR